MSHRPDPWKLLVRAARGHQTEAAMPFGFDTRVIAAFKSGLGSDEGIPWTTLLRGALACASVIMLVTLLATLRDNRSDEPNELAVAESVIQMSVSR